MDVRRTSAKMGMNYRRTVDNVCMREHADAAIVAAEQYEQQKCRIFSDCSHVLFKSGGKDSKNIVFLPVITYNCMFKLNLYIMEKRILVVDDEADIRDILQFNLENAGFEVDCAASAEEALEVLSQKHSLILLDVMMHGMSGFQMAQLLREERGDQTPIIFLTAKDTQDDLLMGFSSGADDYISKPFSIQEVIARVNAVLRRVTSVMDIPAQRQDIYTVGRVEVDRQKKSVKVCGQPVQFSKKEFEILNLLASNQGNIFSREDLINELWKDAPYVLDRTVDVHIARIRSKLGECKVYLTNRSGYGYTFNPVD